VASLEPVLIIAEPVLLLAVVSLLFRAGGIRRFPALLSYFGLRLASIGFLEAIRVFHFSDQIYFYGFYAAYIIRAVASFFVIQEVFTHLMEPVPGLRRLGLIAFRWITIISVIISAVAIAIPVSQSGFKLHLVMLPLTLGISIMELCLLVFLALAIHSLGRSFRSRIFGIALGFGVQASMDLVTSALAASRPASYAVATMVAQITGILTLLIWTAYFLVPEPAGERTKIVLPAESPILRWNEIARALGHNAPQVAVGTATSGFFLQEVEHVVDKVLAKNALSTARD
jgi:hypothetical protein